ncbi:MAG: hypothetical protein LIP04_14730 [Tannerellaceae bacterium]|nr:hypothetical protein [Tannerellaceae bacterium]
MEKDSGNFFRELKENVKTYAELKLEFLKLSTYERIGRVLAKLSYGLILIAMILFALLFLFFSAGYYLGDMLNSYGLGFLCVALFYVLLIILIIVFKRQISYFVLDEIIAALNINDEKEDHGLKDSEEASDGV